MVGAVNVITELSVFVRILRCTLLVFLPIRRHFIEIIGQENQMEYSGRSRIFFTQLAVFLCC